MGRKSLAELTRISNLQKVHEGPSQKRQKTGHRASILEKENESVAYAFHEMEIY